MITASVTHLWQKLTEHSIVLQFIDATLRGCGQVMFQNNPLTGLLFFMAIFLGTYFEGMLYAGLACLLSTVVATLTGYCYRLDNHALRSGLCGYNGCLVGISLATFLPHSLYLWVAVVLGAVFSVIVTRSLANFFKNHPIVALTAPFVLVTWMILLGSYAFAGLKGLPLPHQSIAEQFTATSAQQTMPPITTLLPTLSRGVSEVFLINSISVGIIFIIGLTLNSLWAAIYALLGSLLSTLIGYFLKANLDLVDIGLYSFNAVLTAIALGTVFNKPTIRATIYTIFAILFTIFLQGALAVALMPIGLPTLTMPFVITVWLFLLPNKDFIINSKR